MSETKTHPLFYYLPVPPVLLQNGAMQAYLLYCVLIPRLTLYVNEILKGSVYIWEESYKPQPHLIRPHDHVK